MDNQDYINALKTTDLRPKKFKLEERKETILMEKKEVSSSKILHELFIQTAEIEAMDEGPERDLAMLRLSMVAELDAVNLYLKFANIASNKDVSKLMIDIADEEKVHAGEFQSLVSSLDDNYDDKMDDGEKEVEDLIGK